MTNKCYTVTLLSVGESLVTFEQGPSGEGSVFVWLAFLFTLTGLVCFALSLRNACDVENLIKVFFFFF